MKNAKIVNFGVPSDHSVLLLNLKISNKKKEKNYSQEYRLELISQIRNKGKI